MRGDVDSGFAIVRPPGHHAEPGACHGFCFYNNAAVAASAARARMGVERVLIVDWDIHHGNGTQHIYAEDPSVMFVSLHMWQHGEYYPCMPNAGPNAVGRGAGAGSTVNVAWTTTGMGDAEYTDAFRRLIMPKARAFDPELVIISCGFDAAEGDPLGGQHVTPPCYAHLTRELMTLAGGRVVVALEGGYNLRAISVSARAVLAALLHDPIVEDPPPPKRGGRPPTPAPRKRIKRSGRKDIEAAVRAHRRFGDVWASDDDGDGGDDDWTAADYAGIDIDPADYSDPPTLVAAHIAGFPEVRKLLDASPDFSGEAIDDEAFEALVYATSGPLHRAATSRVAATVVKAERGAAAPAAPVANWLSELSAGLSRVTLGGAPAPPSPPVAAPSTSSNLFSPGLLREARSALTPGVVAHVDDVDDSEGADSAAHDDPSLVGRTAGFATPEVTSPVRAQLAAFSSPLPTTARGPVVLERTISTTVRLLFGAALPADGERGRPI